MKALIRIILPCSLALAGSGLRANIPEPTISAPSSTAQRLYADARKDLLQIRVLVSNGRTQSSVGSGFLLGDTNLVVTNYHVIAQLAQESDTYSGEYLDTEGRRGSVELVALDVLRDLAIVRVDRHGSGAFTLLEAQAQLAQGEYLYALGNPLDLGFTISEGTYNGVVRRDFSDLLLFSGALNPGMSGGPSITSSGQVAGVNVSHRLDGELVSFLVPVNYLRDLLESVSEPPPEDFHPLIAEQLLEHQTLMLDRLLETPLSHKQLGDHLVPVRESDQLRCRGSANPQHRYGFSFDRVHCAMESGVFVSSELRTGHITINHSLLRRTELDRWRFADMARTMFSDQVARPHHSTLYSGPECTEDFIDSNGLALRAVLCFSAYNKLEGLYLLDLFSVTTDDADNALLSQLRMRGVSWDNGLRLAGAFLGGLQSAAPDTDDQSARQEQP